MIAAPEPDCWLHPDVEVRTSPIHGRGLFARARIPAGTVVSRLGGQELRDRYHDHWVPGLTSRIRAAGGAAS